MTKGTKTKKTAKSSVAADYLKRLGREVVKMARASDTKTAYRLTLKCGHVRVGTKRKSLRCAVAAGAPSETRSPPDREGSRAEQAYAVPSVRRCARPLCLRRGQVRPVPKMVSPP
jgi:hypothetical protein